MTVLAQMEEVADCKCERCLMTNRNGFDRFDQFFALHILEDFVELSERKFGLIPDVLIPDTWNSMIWITPASYNTQSFSVSFIPE